MNKICTDLSQSKKLKELGIDVNTADMCYPYDRHLDKMYGDIPYAMGYKRFNESTDIPAWSLSALLGLMPKHIKQEDERTYKFHIFNDDGIVIKRWGCSYVAEDYHNRAEYLSDPKLKYPTNIYGGKYEDVLDAAYEMIVWLKENGKI